MLQAERARTADLEADHRTFVAADERSAEALRRQRRVAQVRAVRAPARQRVGAGMAGDAGRGRGGVTPGECRHHPDVRVLVEVRIWRPVAGERDAAAIRRPDGITVVEIAFGQLPQGAVVQVEAVNVIASPIQVAEPIVKSLFLTSSR